MPIPPHRVPGDSGHVDDHNAMADVLTSHDSSIATTSASLTNHTGGADPHGDRAYADSTKAAIGHTHSYPVTSVNGKTGVVSLGPADVSAVPVASEGVANGVATLDASTLVPTAQIPNLAASKITSGTFAIAQIPTGTTSTTVSLGNHTHTFPVTSVNTKTGVVVLVPSDIGAVATSAVGAASGVASLDSGTKIPIAQVPTGTSTSTVAFGYHVHDIPANYTANHTATTSETVMTVSASSASVTITLPTAVGNAGKNFYIKRTDTTYANTVTVATTSSQTIDGATTYTMLWVQYAFVEVVSDGANWQIIGASALPESWQAVSFASQWGARGAGFSTLQYRRLPGGTQVQWAGDATFTGNGTVGQTSGGAVINAVPTAYRTTNEQHFWVSIAGGTGSPTMTANRVPLAAIDSTGVLKCYNVTSSVTSGQTSIMQFDGIVPLDI